MEEEIKGITNIQKVLKRYKTLFIILIMAVTCLGVFALSLVLYTWDRGLIAKGVILEIPLGRLPLEEARSELEQYKNELHSSSVHFSSDEQYFSINMEELGFSYSYIEALQQAFLIGREGNIFNKAMCKFKASRGITFKADYQWNEPVLTATLSEHLSSLNIPAEDAYFSIDQDNSRQIIPEKIGKQVDIDALITSIKNQPPAETQIIPILFQAVTPSITKTVLENVKLNNLLGQYTTNFNSNLKGRTLNIKLAAKAIDGKVLEPGGMFSFNNTVGPRTAEAGYQEAIIIEGNKFIPGLGGGVCQVSSTLYNAILLASSSFSIIERSHHSLPVTYVPAGQDATVAYPLLDLKFKNDSDGYILIRSSVNGNTLTFSIYGKEI